METTERFLPMFIRAYEKAYGISISRQDAEREFSKLLQLYKAVYLAPMPLPKPQLEERTQHMRSML